MRFIRLLILTLLGLILSQFVWANALVVDTIKEGEERVIPSNGVDYHLKLVNVPDLLQRAVFSLNGEYSRPLRPRERYTFSDDSILVVGNIFPNEAAERTGQDIVEYYFIGSGSVAKIPLRYSTILIDEEYDMDTLDQDGVPVRIPGGIILPWGFSQIPSSRLNPQPYLRSSAQSSIRSSLQPSIRSSIQPSFQSSLFQAPSLFQEQPPPPPSSQPPTKNNNNNPSSKDACGSDDDCDDGDGCTTDACLGSPRSCTHQKSMSGCSFGTHYCVPYFRSYNIPPDSGLFCSMDGRWVEQKKTGDACKGDFECLSGICDKKKCASSIAEEHPEEVQTPLPSESVSQSREGKAGLLEKLFSYISSYFSKQIP